MLPQTYEDS